VNDVRDIALTSDGRGGVLAHRADCPEARQMADRGEPVLTMFGIEKPLEPNIRRHTCLMELKS
jgi:hypothetical protein